jgi:hypothetical protein
MRSRMARNRRLRSIQVLTNAGLVSAAGFSRRKRSCCSFLWPMNHDAEYCTCREVREPNTDGQHK